MARLPIYGVMAEFDSPEALLEAIAHDRRRVHTLPGVVSLEGEGPPPRLIQSLDALRPARDLLPRRHKYFIGTLDPCASADGNVLYYASNKGGTFVRNEHWADTNNAWSLRLARAPAQDWRAPEARGRTPRARPAARPGTSSPSQAPTRRRSRRRAASRSRGRSRGRGRCRRRRASS